MNVSTHSSESVDTGQFTGLDYQWKEGGILVGHESQLWNLTKYKLCLILIIICFLHNFLSDKSFAEMFLLIWLLCACNCASDIVVQRGIGSFQRKCIPMLPSHNMTVRGKRHSLIPEFNKCFVFSEKSFLLLLWDRSIESLSQYHHARL